MHQSLVLSLDEWIKKIHSQITSFFQESKEIRIHKEKFSTLFVELKSFNQKTATKKLPTTPLNPTQTNTLRSVMTLFSSIKKLIDMCKESTMIETIINLDLDDFLNTLSKFREGFNQFTQFFDLLNQFEDPCTCDEHQLNKDNIYDSKDIIEIINTYLNENKNISLESKEALENRLNEYQEIIDNSQQFYEDENDKQRQISEAEYLKRIQEISNCFVDRDDFQKNEKIGSGGFGYVYTGIQKSTGKVVAIKELYKLRYGNFKVSDLKSIIYEVSIMSEIKHYGILPLIGYIPTSPYTIITEYMVGGTLKDRIFKKEKTKPLDGTKLTIIALGVAYAMRYIHSKRYIHRDLKPENIMLDADDYPYVIDFGLSRLLPKDENEYMTNDIGTPAFMAPEFFGEEPYTIAVDVYSYGMTLYVMLTGQNPYNSNMKFYAVLRALMAGERPKIPSDAVTIAPLIEKCWSQNPKDRPTFDEIVSILETGEIFFPGTNKSQVNSYKNIYKKKTGEMQSPKKSDEVAPESIQKVDVNKLQAQLVSVKLDDSALAIEKIERNIHNKSYLEKLLKSPKFIQSLLNACDKCESLIIAQKIIKIFTAVLKIQKTLDQSCIKKAFGLFVKLGSTEMNEILDFIDSFPEKELKKVKLDANQLNKFAPFLKHSEVSLRVEATNALIKLIKCKCYSKVDFLITNLKEVISNIASSVSSMPDLLLSSLIVVNLLLPFKELNNTFLDGKIFKLTVSIFTFDQKSREDIFKEACDALKTIVKIFRGKLDEEDMKIALLSLQQATKCVVESQLVNYVASIINLLQLKVLYSAIENDSENIFPCCFESFLKGCKSNESIILFLKFCYSLLSDEESHNCLSSISSVYLNLILNSNNSKYQKSIQSIATCCLIQSINDMNISSIFTNDLKKFIKKSLQSKIPQDESTLNSLRICSAISSRRKGAEFLMNDNIIELVEFYLKNDNQVTFKLAVMIYSSFSAVYPGSDRIISSVSTILKMMNNKKYNDLLPYVVSFLVNATICSEAAIECAKNISAISEALNNFCSTNINIDIETKQNKLFIIYKLINVLINIAVCQNAFNNITNSKDFTIICKAAKQPFCDDVLGCFLDLFSRISRTKIGIEAIKNSDLSTFLIEKVEKMNPNDIRRARILRLFATSM